MREVLQHLLQRAGALAATVRAGLLRALRKGRRTAYLRAGALTAALFLVAGAVPGAAVVRAPAVPVPVPTVTPALVDEALDPDDTLTVEKTVTTPSVPPRPDVVLMVDGTFSMDTTIVPLKRDLKTITDEVRQAQPDSRFGVVTYGDAADGEHAFIVRQQLTHDLGEVEKGVQALDSDLGQTSGGPAEDWINALWRTANGAAGAFREGASPIIVLVGDASSHDPSLGHPLSEAVNALKNAGARVVAVDIETSIGDGLNGTGGPYAEPGETPPDSHHEGDQATKVVKETDGSLLKEVDPPQVVEKIVEGLTNLRTVVAHQMLDCDPYLSVTLAPQSKEVVSGQSAAFTETVAVAEDAPQGTTLECTVQFSLNGKVPEDAPGGDPVPDYHQRVSIDVNDVGKPEVTVDDRTVEATGDSGAKVELTATATDAVDGELPVTCEPASGSTFPVGRTQVSCTATDSAGNTGSDTATVTVSPLPDPPDPPDPPDEPDPPDPPDPPVPPDPPEADLAVTADISPARNYTGERNRARFTLSNAGPDAARGVVISTRWPGANKRSLSGLSACTRSDPCTIPAGGRRTVTQSAVYRTALTGEVRASVDGARTDPRRADNTDTARLRILQPKLTLTPEVGRPGQVVHARGKDFPPRATVRLSWKPGITAARSPVRVGADGTFEAQVLILRKDRLGPRKLRARVKGLGQREKEFLVIQRHLSPPDFTGRS